MKLAMSLADAAELVPQSRKGPDCSVATLLDQLEDDDRDNLLSWLALKPAFMAHSRISRILRTAGYTISAGTIGRHRKGECACLRS
jgi:hypothetical protein